MGRDEFIRAVRKAVARGDAVNAAKLSSKHDIDSAEAKKWLDAMYEDGELEMDLEGDDFVYKRGRKLKEPEDDALGDIKDKITDALVPVGKAAMADAAKNAASKALDDTGTTPTGEKMKSLKWGVGLGFLLPGFGLFYAAPWVTALVASAGMAGVIALLWLIGYIPVLGSMVGMIILAAVALISGVLGGVYTYKYNKTGKRTRLSKATDKRKALPF